MLFIFCFVLLAVFKIVSSCEDNCIPLPECGPLLAYYTAPLTPKTAKILRAQHCGFAGKVPKVCCPKISENLEAILPEVCGQSAESKIFGGEKTQLDEFPWLALLEAQKSNGTKVFNCGGALINKRYILTAAHCLSPQLIGVRLGEYDTSTEIDCLNTTLGEDCAPKPINLQIEEMILHEGYNHEEFNQYHDIGLIRLNKDVKFTDYVKPICLPQEPQEFTKTYLQEHVFAAGWGRTENGTTSSKKLKVQIPVKTHSFCEATYKKFMFNLSLSEGQFCAGGETGRDSCMGDSGGPLMTVRNKPEGTEWYAAGVVSFGPQPCGMPNWGSIYTRVSKYVDWIKSKLKP